MKTQKNSNVCTCVPFYTKNNKSWECDKTKRLEGGAVNCGSVTRKYMGWGRINE